MKKVSLLAAAILGAVFAVPAMAQDPTKVDAKHYKVEFENDQVRILRIKYGPKEKSVMHEHPAAVAVFLTDGSAKFGLPDGKTQDAPIKAGVAQFSPAGKPGVEPLSQAMHGWHADKMNNPLKNAPHTAQELLGEWKHGYSKQQAFFPMGDHGPKFWPPVKRVDNVYGDRNLVCSCPPMEEYAQAAE